MVGRKKNLLKKDYKQKIKRHGKLHRLTRWHSAKIKFKTGDLCTMHQANSGEGTLHFLAYSWVLWKVLQSNLPAME
jgi:hypothetical protein